MTTQNLFVGIDVSKSRLDTALRPSGQIFAHDNDADGIAALVARLAAQKPALKKKKGGKRLCSWQI